MYVLVDMFMIQQKEMQMAGIAPGTSFEALPEDWVCPICALGKDAFDKM